MTVGGEVSFLLFQAEPDSRTRVTQASTLMEPSKYLLLALISLLFSANFANAETRGIPTSDASFAARVLTVAVAGRKTSDVVDDITRAGFTCTEKDNRMLTGEREVRYQKHVCGAPVPALHGCARNVELGSFDGIVKHIRLSFMHPDGTSSEGIACAR